MIGMFHGVQLDRIGTARLPSAVSYTRLIAMLTHKSVNDVLEREPVLSMKTVVPSQLPLDQDVAAIAGSNYPPVAWISSLVLRSSVPMSVTPYSSGPLFWFGKSVPRRNRQNDFDLDYASISGFRIAHGACLCQPNGGVAIRRLRNRDASVSTKPSLATPFFLANKTIHQGALSC